MATQTSLNTSIDSSSWVVLDRVSTTSGIEESLYFDNTLDDITAFMDDMDAESGTNEAVCTWTTVVRNQNRKNRDINCKRNTVHGMGN